VGVGFFLGSKLGTGPYEQIEARVREIAKQPEVRKVVETTTDVARSR